MTASPTVRSSTSKSRAVSDEWSARSRQRCRSSPATPAPPRTGRLTPTRPEHRCHRIEGNRSIRAKGGTRLFPLPRDDAVHVVYDGGSAVVTRVGPGRPPADDAIYQRGRGSVEGCAGSGPSATPGAI